jgi:hypothetical protein
LPRDVAERLAPGLALPSRAQLEPLYVELLGRWKKQDSPADAPSTLQELVERSLRRFPPSQQRTIQALAVAGAGTMRDIAEMLPRPDDLDDAIRPLADARVIEVSETTVRLRNPAVGRVALAIAPAGAVADLHARALAAVADEPFTAELRAHHALRAEQTFETFMVVEQAAEVRVRCGDDEAVVHLLRDALSVAREQELRGDSEAQVAVSARLVFGRKLGDALIKVGRLDQAYGVLRETLELALARDPVRALVLERLAMIAYHRGRQAEAEERRAEALAIADRGSDRELVERLRAPTPRIESRPQRRALFKTPTSGAPIPRSAPPVTRKRASDRG